MTKLSDKIKAFKVQYPTLTKGVNDQVVELTSEEYEATIAEWAQNELNAEATKAEKQILIEQKAALLSRLGLTSEEAILLLTDLVESPPISNTQNGIA